MNFPTYKEFQAGAMATSTLICLGGLSRCSTPITFYACGSNICGMQTATHMLKVRKQQTRALCSEPVPTHCKCIGRTPFDCLQYIFHQQDWEALSNTFWLNICVGLLLNIVDGKPTPNLALDRITEPGHTYGH